MGLSDYFRVGASVLRAADYVLILKIAAATELCLSRDSEYVPGNRIMAKLAFVTNGRFEYAKSSCFKSNFVRGQVNRKLKIFN